MTKLNLKNVGAQKAASIIVDSGGKVVGRTRMQKIAYLLTLTGLEDGFEFEYRHYGPFSENLSSSLKIATLFGLIEEKTKKASWGGVYSIFNSDISIESNSVRKDFIKEAIDIDSVVLELAATAAFLSFETKEPWEETARRKPKKATAERIKKAKALYQSLRSVETPKPLPAI